MNDYDHRAIEKKWQTEWAKKKAYKAENSPRGARKKKYYVLDMFPYPSGAGLHVGHPKGYIGSDVFARFKRMQGFNVLHPMGYDAFGLPAEQYALQHNIHPREAVIRNIKTFESQLKIIGLSYDWDRTVNTTDPEFYRWTQWIFLKLYDAWYDTAKQKARPVSELIKIFEKSGNGGVRAACGSVVDFSATEWKTKTAKEQQDILMQYRLAYEGYSEVNWSPQLGTVLANDEIIDGPNGPVSERGGFPVEKKSMRQWFLRITAYADRLLAGLDGLDWSSHIKEIQRNWIGKSEGSLIRFKVVGSTSDIEIFTTRPDTLFGVTYVVLAPENALVQTLKPQIKNWAAVESYIEQTRQKKTEERGAEKEKTGVVLEGVTAINPINGERVPVWIADYVLADYGTGAVMAVPAHDERDFDFAAVHGLPVKYVITPFIVDKKFPPVAGQPFVARPNIHAIVRDPKTNTYLCLNWKKFPWTTFIVGGVEAGEDAISAAKREVLEETGYKNIRFVRYLGGPVKAHYNAAHKKQNREAITRGILFELVDNARDKVATEESDAFDVEWLPLSALTPERMTCAELAEWLYFLKQENGAYTGTGLLYNSGEFTGKESESVMDAITKKAGGMRTTTYKMRDAVFARQRYWGEPIPLRHDKKGLIQPLAEKDLPLKLPNVASYQPTGTGDSPLAAVPAWIKKGYETNTMPGWAGSSWYFLRYMDPKGKRALADKKAIAYWKNVDMYVGGAEHATGHLLYSRFWHKFLKDIGVAVTEEPFMRLRNQGMILGSDNRKMSKRWGNVINPDDVVGQLGADTLRVYEMFMGPFDASLPWSTDNIVGSRRFLERVWKLNARVNAKAADPSSFEMLIHKTIKKVTEDIENFTFNTSVSALMIVVNEMEKLEKISRKNFELFLKVLSPFAPHLAEELWRSLGNKTLVVLEKWPTANPKKMIQQEFIVVIQINGKMRGSLMVPAGASEEEVTSRALALPEIEKWLIGKEIVKKIYIPGKLLNVVIF